MPAYDFRCKACGQTLVMFYKNVPAYEEARAEDAINCPHCGSHDVERVITDVAIPKQGRSYANLNANEMLSVLESGDERAAAQLFSDTGADQALSDPKLRGAVSDATTGSDE